VQLGCRRTLAHHFGKDKEELQMSTRGGLYVVRADKPHSFLGLPIIGRHFAYAGMTNSFAARQGQHERGSVIYGSAPASWSDLRPKFYRLPLPYVLTHPKFGRKGMKALETVLIYALCPVYNVTQQPPWNLRKMTRTHAARERARRDDLGVNYRVGRWAVRMTVYLLIAFIVGMVIHYA
jgi:hypothetical protein